uniref:PS II complex 12 kDa extrinsic protein n=1 Tax=Chaetoceros debilis TaxID=122233 RepID=A0A7S3PZG3_9STRA
MKLFLFFITLSTANAFLLATRAVKSPGFSLKSLQKPKPAPSPKKAIKKKASPKAAQKKASPKATQKKASPKADVATAGKEWRLFGRDRDSKTPPLFLKNNDGSKKLGNYPDLSGFYKPENAVKRNPYKNNAPVE